jgi:hypothetical protein
VTLPSLSPHAESPSLAPRGDPHGPAFELKFLIDDALAAQVESWAARRLTLDPHADPALGGAYRTTSLYFDTPQLDVYHRATAYRRRKFRIRRYGAAPLAYLERKSKWGDRVEKRRTSLPEHELPLLLAPPTAEDWPGFWFQRRLMLRNLRPACKIIYHRTAYIDGTIAAPLRLTLDRNVRGILSSGWGLVPHDGGLPLLRERVILELKFRNALPVPFRELIADLRLTPGAVSKYRLCREAWDLQPVRESADA